MADAATLTLSKSKSTPPAAPKERPTIEFSRGNLREQKANNYLVIVPAGTKPEDYVSIGVSLDPGRYALTTYDLVDAVPKDERWFGQYVVADSGPGWATLVLLRSVELPSRKDVTEARVPANHRVQRGAPDEGWCVYRETDGVMMSTGHRDYETALRWILDHATMRQR